MVLAFLKDDLMKKEDKKNTETFPEETIETLTEVVRLLYQIALIKDPECFQEVSHDDQK